MGGVTIKDVARAAEVSIASVSRVLNGYNNVTAETRTRILEAAKALRYIPHEGARSLITRRTQIVGVLLPDMFGEFFSEIVRGVDAAARARGLSLLVSGSHGDAAETAAAIRAMRGRVDGLLVMSPHADDAFLADNLPPELPTVLMNTRIGSDQYSSFNVDNYGGARAMVQHLVASGHRRISHIAGPADNLDAEERLQGYRDEIAQSAPEAWEQVIQGAFTEESGYQAGREILRQGHLPDAIFAGNDMMALGCLFALNESGIQVPGQISLAGFDDVPIARYVSPPLTTVRVKIADLGGQALAQLANVIEDPDLASISTELIRPELVVRSSCKHKMAVSN